MEEGDMETEGNITIPAFLTQKMNTTSTTTTEKSLHVFKRIRRRCRDNDSKEMMLIKEDAKEKEEDEEGGDDDREEIERKIHALQRIVPNGESFGVDKLFDETAGYIIALQYQVKALKALTGFFEKLEKDKTKLGG
ncbi:transcription factor PAR1 [Trifolium pratense]|uniref:transcription factor PAR1 n=1 Tax=Trifolium pratense TaxID=57577 RepID=UPI001E697B2F|nr:transcription factor PAR1 [Trifolium pratense]